MKNSLRIGLLLVALFSNALSANEIYQIKLFDFSTPPTAGGGTLAVVGKEREQFTLASGEKTLRLQVQVPLTVPLSGRVKNRAYLKIVHDDKGRETPVHEWQWPATTPKLLSTDAYFLPGKHTITLHDGENQAVILAKRVIVVEAGAQTGASDFPYDRKHFKIWTSRSVDDNWKPVGITQKIKAGSCITLFFESQVKLKNLGMMRWGIYRVLPNGREEYVNQKDQGIQLQEWRRLTHEECSDFASKGNYRIYFATKDDSDVYSGVNNKNYFARADLQVE